MRTIIALTGGTCTGKTTISTLLGQYFACDVRHCGEIVKARAHQLQIDVAELPPHEHAAIDRQTRELALCTASRMIVEGRYLSDVLAGVSDVVSIVLRCTDRTRALRQQERLSSPEPLLRHEMMIHSAIPCMSSGSAAQMTVTIDTDEHTARQIAVTIARFVSEVENDVS